MKLRRGRAWALPMTQLVTFRRAASYRTPGDELVIPEGTQLIGVSQARNSVRVWCDWLVARGALSRSPFAD